MSVSYREKMRQEGEAKLQRELERLREQTRQELDHTKSYTKELYERENRCSAHVHDTLFQPLAVCTMLLCQWYTYIHCSCT